MLDFDFENKDKKNISDKKSILEIEREEKEKKRLEAEQKEFERKEKEKKQFEDLRSICLNCENAFVYKYKILTSPYLYFLIVQWRQGSSSSSCCSS